MTERAGPRRQGLAEPGLSHAERAYRAIRDRLVMLDIRPGAPVNEEQLAHSLGLGRTPVREALKRLQYERLIAAYPRRGTFATEVNITDLAHISEVRRQLEPMAAAQAARRAGAGDRARLTALLREPGIIEGPETGSAPRPPEELMRLDLAVHRAIYTAARNPYLEDTLVQYDNLATRVWCLFVDRLPGMADHIREHGPLLRTVVAGDAEKAAELARGHIDGFERAIRAVI
ncbi:GntR family transcriptional regulator [Streptomyces corynorhini]|uniref:GntR family transcriptional regulator n=1 Tax=Streptomyces corynorhini TaxID=2282652 RepID=A0A370B979_9ACTN|nr:GntR family transcriptional regulator [Streptomyces corynorhini]RDG36286.1 GntR family transcriptional regulator [Streptomyces corynorhini]